MIRSPDAPSSGRAEIWGLDLIRLAAMGAVALLHLCAVSGRETGVVLYHLGVPVFAALSGYLALRGGGSTRQWLSKRVGKIYVSYWLSLIPIFLANRLTTYKPVSPELFACQWAGIAAFTHPGRLIGVHTWFVSFILACYLMAALIRVDRRLLPVFVALALGLMVLGIGPFRVEFLTFLAGGLAAQASSARVGAAWVVAAALALVAVFGAGALGVLTGTAALLIATFLVGRRSPRLVAAGDLSYEFYLTHGPIYLSLAKLGGLGFVANLLIGTPLAMTTAWLLNRAARSVRAAA
jgi:peptidoglycan/LPS O-acetylase OafA/YrhL